MSVEEFQAIGINATTRNEAGGTWGDNRAFGNFDSQMNWEMCGSVNEPWNSSNRANVDWTKPQGERADGNYMRWSGEAAEKSGALLDEMGSLHLGDPKVEALFVEASRSCLTNCP